jgi:nucleotidyltransferase substrate binding protein (TIGR01987 family)
MTKKFEKDQERAPHLEFQSLQKAVLQLEQGLVEVSEAPNNELMRDGVIQRFEYTMDLCWKFIQRYLKDFTDTEEASIRSKKDLFREAARLSLIKSAADWIGHYEARNTTAHSYDSQTAKAVFARARAFAADARALLESLQHAARRSP